MKNKVMMILSTIVVLNVVLNSSFKKPLTVVREEPLGTTIIEAPIFENQGVEWLEVPKELLMSDLASQIIADLAHDYYNSEYLPMKKIDPNGNRRVEIMDRNVDKEYSYDKDNQKLQVILDFDNHYRIKIVQVEEDILIESNFVSIDYEHRTKSVFRELELNKEKQIINELVIRNYFFYDTFLDIDIIQENEKFLLIVNTRFDEHAIINLNKEEYDLLAYLFDTENVIEFLYSLDLFLNGEKPNLNPVLSL